MPTETPRLINVVSIQNIAYCDNELYQTVLGKFNGFSAHASLEIASWQIFKRKYFSFQRRRTDGLARIRLPAVEASALGV